MGRRRRELSRRLNIPIALALFAVQRRAAREAHHSPHPQEGPNGRGRRRRGGGREGGAAASGRRLRVMWRGGEQGRDGESSLFLFLFGAASN